jgi:hypothetical protein
MLNLGAGAVVGGASGGLVVGDVVCDRLSPTFLVAGTAGLVSGV